MANPIRIQRKRTKGWRTPENTVYVGRGSRWGNPFKIGEGVMSRSESIDHYKTYIEGEDLSTIRGKNLSCWCPLDQACHADVLLDIANA